MEELVDMSDSENPIQYSGTIVTRFKSPYQEWCLMDTTTNGRCLFIDNELQSCEEDEAIYHEMMVHSLMSGVLEPKRVLILGGAEGYTAREVLKWKTVEEIVQIDWDESLVNFYKTYKSEDVYKNSKVKVYHQDALEWLKNCTEKFDCIFIDLIDPKEESLSFFMDILTNVKKILARGGGMSINAGEIRKGAHTTACDLATILVSMYERPRYSHTPLRITVPSFQGEWCFFMITSPTWCFYFCEPEKIKSLSYFTKEKCIESMMITGDYCSELKQFWRGDIQKIKSIDTFMYGC